jgi:small GTP-binding protein
VRDLAAKLKKCLPHSQSKKQTPSHLAMSLCTHLGRQQYVFSHKQTGKEYIFSGLKSVTLPFDAAATYAAKFDIGINLEDFEPRIGALPRGNAGRPVAVVLGHVDHGKTTLLDSLRGTSVASRETGGITQNISASTIELQGKDGAQNGVVTFIDTPGHGHFFRMRQSGSLAADFALLVVAADEGPGPQTVEALEGARAIGLPIIVVLSKMDSATDKQAEGALATLAGQLLPSGALGPASLDSNTDCDGMSGKTDVDTGIFDVVAVSSFTRMGLDALSGAVLDCAAAQQAVRTEELAIGTSSTMEYPAMQAKITAEATTIDVFRDRSKGTLLQIILRAGQLAVGDSFACGLLSGKVRLMLDDRGRQVKTALPGMFVQVAGVHKAGASHVHENPPVGEAFWAMTKCQAERLVDHRRLVFDFEESCVTEDDGTIELPEPSSEEEQEQGGLTCTHSDGQENEACEDILPDDICVAVKADNAASLTTVLDAVMLAMPAAYVSFKGIGDVTRADIDQAAEFDIDTILTFNVKAVGKQEKLHAEKMGVQLRHFDILHELIETLRDETESKARAQVADMKAFLSEMEERGD